MNHKYLTERERYQLEILLKQKTPKTKIAKLMGISRQTIYNEIERGTVVQLDNLLAEKKVYCADVGQRKLEEHGKNKGRPWKIENDYEFVKFVEYWIVEMRYSPYAVLQQIKRENRNFKTKICEKTLYNYIHLGVFLNVTTENLPYKPRQKKEETIKRNVSLKNPTKPSIENRPKEVYNRETYGHWEMDTVYSSPKKDKTCLLVLTEKKTRDEIIIKMKDRKASSVVSAMDRLYRIYGAKRFRETFKTITCDNGSEFSDYENLVRNNRFQIYFCHPYCSSERASNENNNKLIRRWVKKGENIKKYKNKDIQFIQDWMNDYPRKIFNGLSAREYSEICTRKME